MLSTFSFSLILRVVILNMFKVGLCLEISHSSLLYSTLESLYELIWGQVIHVLQSLPSFRRSISGSKLCWAQAKALDPGHNVAKPGATVHPAPIHCSPNPGGPQWPCLEELVWWSHSRGDTSSWWLWEPTGCIPQTAADTKLVSWPYHCTGAGKPIFWHKILSSVLV